LRSFLQSVTACCDSEIVAAYERSSLPVLQKLILHDIAKPPYGAGADLMEATKKIRIVVADDSTIYRNNVCLMLGLQNDMEVVAEAENGWAAIELVKEHKPDILLIDIRMPFIDGIDATRKISYKFPDVKVIGMSAHDDCGYNEKLRQSGAWGYLDKACVLKDLLSAIRKAYSADHRLPTA
jgi:DNA-binding NarL/FixJ family response regulator